MPVRVYRVPESREQLLSGKTPYPSSSHPLLLLPRFPKPPIFASQAQDKNRSRTLATHEGSAKKKRKKPSFFPSITKEE